MNDVKIAKGNVGLRSTTAARTCRPLASSVDGALGRPPHRSGAPHQRTPIREHPEHKARLFMSETAGTCTDVRTVPLS